MKKLIVFVVLIIIGYYGYQVYLRNKPVEEAPAPYVFDENYVLALTFQDDLVSKLVEKTYYIYDNDRATLERVVSDRSTGEYIETTYEDIQITDEDFNVKAIIKALPSAETGIIDTIYRYKFYIKSKKAVYNLSYSEENTQTVLKAVGAIKEVNLNREREIEK